MLPFPEFVGGEAVAVCGKGLHDGFERVGRIEPLLRVEILFHAFDLGVKRLRDEEVGAVDEIFKEALRVSVDEGCVM